jgi:Tol biopolymer transport system component
MIDIARFDHVTEPSWDPTGRQLAFAAHSGEGYDIYVVRIDN